MEYFTLLSHLRNRLFHFNAKDNWTINLKISINKDVTTFLEYILAKIVHQKVRNCRKPFFDYFEIKSWKSKITARFSNRILIITIL
jgi:hypothetical protein